VGLVSPIPPIARLLRDPTVRAIYAWLPDWARPPLKKWGAVLKVSESLVFTTLAVLGVGVCEPHVHASSVHTHTATTAVTVPPTTAHPTQVSGSGEVLDWLMDPAGAHVHTVSSAVEHDGCLFLGNLAGDSVSYVDLGVDGSAADGACMCRCKCGGVELPLPVRLLPPQEVVEEQQQQQQQQEQEQEQEQQQQEQQQEQEEDAAPQAPPAPDGLHSEL
jgi:hypothetical protein